LAEFGQLQFVGRLAARHGAADEVEEADADGDGRRPEGGSFIPFAWRRRGILHGLAPADSEEVEERLAACVVVVRSGRAGGVSPRSGVWRASGWSGGGERYSTDSGG